MDYLYSKSVVVVALVEVLKVMTDESFISRDVAQKIIQEACTQFRLALCLPSSTLPHIKIISSMQFYRYRKSTWTVYLKDPTISFGPTAAGAELQTHRRQQQRLMTTTTTALTTISSGGGVKRKLPFVSQQHQQRHQQQQLQRQQQQLQQQQQHQPQHHQPNQQQQQQQQQHHQPNQQQGRSVVVQQQQKVAQRVVQQPEVDAEVSRNHKFVGMVKVVLIDKKVWTKTK
eukprot:GHVS01008572.1.p2 GENE.GHVS01008572.1~~GHVS01008572.1.p2  ORF type:complete len:229 (+),score=103.74 GHVS01008572.1:919-1605(+)